MNERSGVDGGVDIDNSRKKLLKSNKVEGIRNDQMERIVALRKESFVNGIKRGFFSRNIERGMLKSLVGLPLVLISLN